MTKVSAICSKCGTEFSTEAQGKFLGFVAMPIYGKPICAKCREAEEAPVIEKQSKVEDTDSGE